MLLPSSARTFTAVSSATVYSLPSPAIWLYTPASSAFNSVDLPWYPPPTINVTPFGMPMPVITPAYGRCISTRRDLGDWKGNASRMGRSDTPDCLGSTAPSATNAARFFSFNCLRRLAVSSARWTAFCNSFAGTAEKYSVFFTHSGRYPNKIFSSAFASIVLPCAGKPISSRTVTLPLWLSIWHAERDKISCPQRLTDNKPLFPEPFAWKE